MQDPYGHTFDQHYNRDFNCLIFYVYTSLFSAQASSVCWTNWYWKICLREGEVDE